MSDRVYAEFTTPNPVTGKDEPNTVFADSVAAIWPCAPDGTPEGTTILFHAGRHIIVKEDYAVVCRSLALYMAGQRE